MTVNKRVGNALVEDLIRERNSFKIEKSNDCDDTLEKLKLDIYESCRSGEITEYERDNLLEELEGL